MEYKTLKTFIQDLEKYNKLMTKRLIFFIIFGIISFIILICLIIRLGGVKK